MKIGIVINSEEIVQPIVKGTILRIYDVENDSWEDYVNPALHLKIGRRSAVLQFAGMKGVRTFAAPPQMFCELSYLKARNDGIRFFHLEEELSFREFIDQVNTGSLKALKEIPENEIAPSL